MSFSKWVELLCVCDRLVGKYVVSIVNLLIYMGVDLEPIKSKPVRALSGCFQLRRPTVCLSYAEGKTRSVFSAYQSLSVYIHWWLIIHLSMYYMVSRPVWVHFYICRVKCSFVWKVVGACYFCVFWEFCLSLCLQITNFTCSSSNSVDLINFFFFFELKVKGVVCLFIYLFNFFCESKVGKKFRFTKIVHAESAMVDRTLRLKTNHIVSHFQFIIIFFK